MESPDDEDEKANKFLMTKQQDNDVTSQFSYHGLFRLCRKLTKETTKLEQIISTFKDTIFSFETKNKTMEN